MDSELLKSESYCRLCLNLVNINHATDLKSNKLLYDIWAETFPGMKRDLVQTPRICETCIDRLQCAVTFKENIMCNELRLQTDKEFIARAVNVCRLCLKQTDGSFVCLYKNSNCSYSYELIRTTIEVVATQLNFDIFENPIMCNQCWLVVKDIYMFKKTCLETEDILRSLCKTKEDLEDDTLADTDILSMIYKKRQLDDSQKTTSSENFGQDIEDPLEIMNCNIIESQKKISAFTLNLTQFNELNSPCPTEFRIKQEVNSDFNHIVSSTYVIPETSKHIPEHITGNEQTNGIDSNICEIKSEICTNNSDFKNMETDDLILDKEIVFCDSNWYSSNNSIKTEIKEEYSGFSENVKAGDVEIYNQAVSDNYDNTDVTYSGQTSQKSPEVDHLKPSKTTHAVTSDVKQFLCGVCQKCFTTTGSLKRHLRVHSEVRDFICDICQKGFRTSGDLKIHKDGLHGTDRPFICDVCQKGFKTKRVLKQHQVVHVESRNFICDVCPKGFKSLRVLDEHKFVHNDRGEHVNTHSDEMPFVCEICQKRFKRRSYLNGHQNIHKSERNHVCNICQKAFKAMKDLKYHVTYVHSEERRFVCDTCQKRFKTMLYLRQHQTIHINSESKYVCNICQKGLRTKFLLREHASVHSDKRRFACDTCQKAFKRSEYLKKHISITHSSERKHVCEICHKTFKTMSYLKRHLTLTH